MTGVTTACGGNNGPEKQRAILVALVGVPDADDWEVWVKTIEVAVSGSASQSPQPTDTAVMLD